MSDIERIEQALDSYHTQYRNSSLRKLTLSGIYSLHPVKNENSTGKSQWPDKWPDVDKPGVYMVLDQDKKLLYVGKSSLGNTIGNRLGSHFQYAKDGSKTCVAVGGGLWSRPPFYVMTIRVDKAFEAPSIEEYLIEVLCPPDNIRGKKHPNYVAP